MDILRNERSAQPPVSSSSQTPASNQPKNENPYTTLGKDTEFEGTLRFKEGLKIEGKFNGDIASDGYLIIGKTGEVTAEIDVGSIIVEGKITGNIVANDLVELRSSAELRGDITASKLKIDEGVIFVGKSDVQPQNARSSGQKAGSSSKQETAKPEESKGDDKKDKGQNK